MVARNDITGDLIVTHAANDAYRDGIDRIFGKKTFKNVDPEYFKKLNENESEKQTDTKD
jgi:hypothetical protein